ncbi:MAG: hypothetical protein A3B89_03245 [Candidatus Buchananbacteria bacterium RIFCSPHIGHO2_02_FULL_40_13]|uniref:Uncharacterized protein n=1 Tax=Candidatus Buchananbacteria bacterium RIFCSPLOWO2_01_FULL_39_33 TaxID=1797543 RepID=A0A1G1YGL5_9BACT|nr:MAG: hypothetical protein A2820_01490 [Candidatus Buchananbacteria bacterium RIFCSPHIGHO2_01_FULL_40_35]OGY50204.1 MAG: hypothetical protein A3B89_03245 [Candidatus Buchananbacteria bacterium RIFCSPHIGHO2_02_FULL_40_13]OGY51439.1 MAG: hypothetical protein A3A02_04600 [Candidatus Buchananbacteria bacterium RIFCSPLOWO2_01_FULL_39_33]
MAELKEINNPTGNWAVKKEPDKKYAEFLNRYFKLIVILIGLVVLFAGYYIVILPKWEMNLERSVDLSTLQNEVYKLQTESEFLSQYSNQIIEFTPVEERQLALALPSVFDLPSIIIQLTKLASDHKFIVESIQADEASANNLSDSRLKKVDIEMAVSGLASNDYGSFSQFIEALESSLMIFDVKAISFTPAKSGYKLELATYYYQD